MEAYKVWVTLNLKGDAHKKLEQFLAIVKKTTIEINKLTKSMEKLQGFYSTFSKILNSSNSEIRIFNTSINQSVNVMNSASISANRLSQSLTQVNIAAARGGNRKGGGSRGGSFLHGAIAGFGAGGLAGLGVAAGGYAVGSTVLGAYHTGTNYQRELALLTSQNIPGLGSAQIESFVTKNATKEVSRLQILSSLVDAATITKTASEAFGVAPTLAKMKMLATATGDENFKMSPAQMQAASKTAEIVSGSKESSVLNKHLNMMFQAWLSSGGRVQPTQYLSIVRSARGYTRGMSPEFFYYGLEPLIQEFGTRLGPMMGQFYQHLKVGRVTTQGAQILGSLGLVNPNDVQLNKMGMIKGIKPGGIVGGETMDKNIFDWIDKFLVPALLKKGFTNTSQQSAILGKIFTNTDLTLVSSYLQQREKINNATQINSKTSGLDEMMQTFMGMHSEHIQRLSTSLENFKLALDKATGPALDKLSDFISKIFDPITSLINYGASKTTGTGTDPYSIFSKINEKHFNDAGITTARSSISENKSVGHVYLDRTKVGDIVFASVGSSMNTYVQHGQSGINSLSQPFFPGINSLQNQGF